MGMEQLALRFLGDARVVRDDRELPLPPSRKTRALLAYLALQSQPFRRDQLCELLWEIPDDPRGSLRWSLSKLRRLVDDEDHPRILADRNQVAMDTSGVDIDVVSLHELAGNKLSHCDTATLQQAVETYSGDFLAGLELANFHDFYIWCLGERERASQARAALLGELVNRLADDPAAALPYASQLCSEQAYDVAARARLIGLLVQLNRKKEADQQFRIGMDTLKEAGIDDGGLLYRSLRGARPAGAARPGAGAPVSSAAAGGESAPASGIAGQQSRLPVDAGLVGRDREQQLLQEAMARAFDESRSRVVLVRGDPGMGKSRMLQLAAAMARQRGAGILRADAYESEMLRPFGVWNDALRRALPGNPASEMITGSERISRDQVFSTLADLVQESTDQRPLAVLFDDLHWCDESSASALHYVLRMHRKRPLLVLATAREQELKENASALRALRDLRSDELLQELHLAPLPEGELEQLIATFEPAADARRLSRECEGNPLLALELARAEVEGSVGHSLAELVAERISRFSEAAVAVLNWAAVLSPRISLSTLEKASGLDRGSINTAIEAAERQGILHPAARGFRFSHDLIARCIYDQISTSRQQAMHREVAEMLAVDAAADLSLAADLAHHAPRSGDSLLSARAMIAAGKLCLRFFANEDALALYQRGLEFTPELNAVDRICCELELAEIRIAAAPVEDWKNTAEELRNLAEQALDHGALAHARLGYQEASYVRWVRGQWSDARRDSLQAARITRGGSDKDHIVGMAEASKCLALLERDLSQADAMIMEASELARRSDFSCTAIPITLGILRYYESRFDEARDYLEEARAACKARGDRINEFMANEFLTMVQIEAGNFPQAAEHCEDLLALGERLREGSELPLALALTGLCRYALEGEQTQLQDGLDQLQALDAKQRRTWVLNRAAMIDLVRGQAALAGKRAEIALELSRTMERPSEILLAAVNLACSDTHPPGVVPADLVENLLQRPVAEWARDRARQYLQQAGRES